MNTIKGIVKWFFIMSGVLIWLAIVIVYGQPNEVVYDCRMAEISPDFPPEVRNECRKLRSVKPISA
jgi:hypothetical protein